MLTIILGVAVFVLVIVALVVVLMVAKSKLVARATSRSRSTTIPDKAISTRAGDTLLNTLAAQKIFIPSACGGKGTCGVCKVEVHSGGGALLPTETSHVNRGEARKGVRLSCQVKVKQDMKIEVEPEVFNVRKWQCRVRSNRNVATFIKELVLELPKGRRFRSAPEATSRSSARRMRSNTPTSRSRRSTGATGTSTTCGGSSRRSTSL